MSIMAGKDAMQVRGPQVGSPDWPPRRPNLSYPLTQWGSSAARCPSANSSQRLTLSTAPLSYHSPAWSRRPPAPSTPGPWLSILIDHPATFVVATDVDEWRQVAGVRALVVLVR